MDNSFQTSFIPKKPITSGSLEKRSFNPFVFIAVALFVLVILATAGLFFYKVYLNNKKEELSTSLNKAKAAFEDNTIKELEQFSKRTESSKEILSKHIVLSPMLALLGKITIPTVQYTKLDHDTTADGKFVVKMQGVSIDYKSIALQSEMFNSPDGQYFKNVVFSNLIRNSIATTGNNYINFDVEFEVDPYLLSYPNQITDSNNLEDNSETTLPENFQEEIE